MEIKHLKSKWANVPLVAPGIVSFASNTANNIFSRKNVFRRKRFEIFNITFFFSFYVNINKIFNVFYRQKRYEYHTESSSLVTLQTYFTYTMSVIYSENLERSMKFTTFTRQIILKMSIFLLNIIFYKRKFTCANFLSPPHSTIHPVLQFKNQH